MGNGSAGESEIYIIIATRNRFEDLKRTLNEIAKQTEKPRAIILSDDSDVKQRKKIEELIEDMKDQLEMHIIDGGGIGSAHARNVAMDYLAEKFEPEDNDIVLFMDDDVDLPDTRTFEKIADTFRHTKIVGLGGYDKNMVKPRIKYIINQTTLAILPKIPADLLGIADIFGEKEVKVQRLSGCFMAYIWKAVKGERFDKQMIKYSLGEDLDLSYRISKKKGDIIAKKEIQYIHRQSPESRITNIAKEIMLITYIPYITAKNARFGKVLAKIQVATILLTRLIASILRRDMRGAKTVIKAYKSARSAILSAINGNLKSANELIITHVLRN